MVKCKEICLRRTRLPVVHEIDEQVFTVKISLNVQERTESSKPYSLLTFPAVTGFLVCILFSDDLEFPDFGVLRFLRFFSFCEMEQSILQHNDTIFNTKYHADPLCSLPFPSMMN